MKFNLKNFPKVRGYNNQFYNIEEVNVWKRGFERELREKLAKAKGWGFDDYVRIKEILGNEF